MARIRTIKPEFPQSETIGSLSRDARLLFILLWTLADDFGRARASSQVLGSLLYPYDDDAGDLIGGWLDELEDKTCIRRYEIEGKRYLDIPNWLKHQKIDHPTPSKLPEFRETLASPRENQRNIRPGPVREGKGGDRDQEGTGTGTRPDQEAPLPSALEGKGNGSARSFASAPNGGALAREPPTVPTQPLPGGIESVAERRAREESNEFRSPPRAKSDNPLMPIPERKPFNRP